MSVLRESGKTRSDTVPFRSLAEEAIARASGSPLIHGNRVRLLKDAAENYPAWIDAIESASRWIHFETFILRDDKIGRHFAELMIRKAAEGVRVRLLYDWIGSLGYASRRFWRGLVKGGVDVRCFNPPGLYDPFSLVRRDHRKLTSVDGRIAFVSGLCVGDLWVGYPEKGLAPWRDTGIQIEGPAVIDLERAFAASWSQSGTPLQSTEVPPSDSIAPVDDVAVRVVASIPNVGSIYRLDQLIAAVARRNIWIAEAYFIATTSYVQALRAAARSGVDVRLLLPGANDVPVMRALARSGLRPLLEAGVRVFEWNGSMMHAKTTVADGQWARVGSTNLNISSWLSNWELDVIIENQQIAEQMEAAFEDDLQNATEIVLHRNRPRARTELQRKPRRGKGSMPRTAASVMRLGHAVSAVIANQELGPAEAIIMAWTAVLLLLLTIVAAYWPRIVAIPLSVLAGWTGLSLIVRAFNVRRKHRKKQKVRPAVEKR